MGDTGAVPYWRLSGWYFFYFGFVGCFLPYFSLYLISVGLDAWRISVVMSVMPLMRMLAPVFWGLMADRLGPRARLVRHVLAASALFFSGFFLTTNFYALIVVMLLMSWFWSASLPLVEALTLGHLRSAPERYGRVRLWGSIGFIVAVQGVGLLLGYLPVSIVLWASISLLVAACVCSGLIPESAPIEIGHEPGRIRDLVRQPKVIALLVAGMLMSVAHAPLYTFYTIHLVAVGYGKAAIGGLWSLGVVAEIVVFGLMPRLMNVGSVRNVLVVCFALATLRFLLIAWFVASPAVAVIAQVLHGASFGAHHAASMVALHRWFTPRQQGAIQSVFGSASYGAGGVIGGVLCGYGWTSFGPGLTFTGAAAFALLGMLLIRFGLNDGDARVAGAAATVM